jgi:hypothetical protein
MELELELKVFQLARSPNQPSVFTEGLSFGNFPNDRALVDPPMVPVPFPAIERAVKDFLWFLSRCMVDPKQNGPKANHQSAKGFAN